MKRKIWKIIHAIFKIRVLEKFLLFFVKGKYSDSSIMRFIPPFYTYKNPSYRIAKKDSLRLYANLYDYNDWKAYWGIKEVERENLYKLAANAETVVDVGTNNGWVLMNIASIVSKQNGVVYGFEPYPPTYKRCIENIRRSGITNATVYNLGCGDKEEPFVMEVVLESNSGQNRIIEKDEIESDKQVAKINVTRLDKQLQNVEKIDLIKIDVEGFELHVLKGADNVLKKYKPVLFMEINDPLLKANKTSPNEVLSFLKNNYQYTFKNAANGQPINETGNFNNRQFDVICYPAGSKIS